MLSGSENSEFQRTKRKSQEIKYGFKKMVPRVTPLRVWALGYDRHRNDSMVSHLIPSEVDAGRERGVGVRLPHNVPFKVPEGDHDHAREAGGEEGVIAD